MKEELLSRVEKERENSLNFYRNWEYVGKEMLIPGRAGLVRTLFYYPEEIREDMPVFFDIHGGGHTVHKAEADQPFCRKLCRQLRGLVVSVDYHLAPEYQWPVQLHEVYDVILHIYQNAEQYHIDPQRMGVGGHSAGGNLAAATALLAKDLGEFSLKCQVLDYPEVDLATKPEDKYEGKASAMVEQLTFFGECYQNADNVKNKYYSPFYAKREELQGLPPTVAVLCENDILYREGLEYAGKLVEAGVETIVKLFQNAEHGFTADYYYRKESQEAHQFMIREIKKYL